MKYFIVEGSFQEVLPVSQAQLQEVIKDHQALLQKGFKKGTILVSGPKAGAGGGFILMKGESQEEIEACLAEDPLKISGIQNYKITEFKLYDCQPELKDWFD